MGFIVKAGCVENRCSEQKAAKRDAGNRARPCALQAWAVRPSLTWGSEF